MTPLATASPTVGLPRFGGRQIVLWAAAAAVVLAAHVVIAYAVQDLRPAEMDGGPPPAQVIELSPMVIMPPAETDVSDVVTPDPAEPVTEPEPPVETAEPVAESPVEQAEPPAEPSQMAATDAIEPTPPATAERVDQPPLEEVVPDIVETVAPDVVIPLPQPKPVETPVETEVKKRVEPKAKTPVKVKKQAEAKVKKPVEKTKRPSKKDKAASPRTKTASVAAKSAPRAAAPKSAKATSASRGDSSRWNSQLSAWIRRHTRYPSAAKARGAQGSPKVTFTVDASGRVLSARLAGSSGDPDLDRAALRALQGAKVPTPPSGLGSRITRTAPFLFNLR
jgi:protein TonB